FSVSNCETEPVYILGNFGLEPAEHGWEIVAPKNLTFGSWKGQGMPFYGQSVKYSKILNTNKKGRFRIELPSWSGTVASVNINGKEVGIQTKSSYLTTELTQGENIIDIFVTGSLKNTLGPHHVLYPHGVAGGRPANFIKAPEKQQGGASYSLLDYRLMQDFRVSAIE
ncbi:MAG: hypothetical protein V9G08_08950, partial [Dermatophilaceae bacterium]